MTEEVAHQEDHSSAIKTPQQLIIVILMSFAVTITILVLLARYAATSSGLDKDSPAMSKEEVAKRLKPVGDVALEEAGAAAVAKSGEQIVKEVCNACHQTGALDAPKVGDNAAWKARLKQGLDKLTEAAIKGKGQMPPKGGAAALSDGEIALAVIYMANQSGAGFKEPAAMAERSGEQIVQAVCSKCHATGEMGAPRIGDKAAWAKRVAQGLDAVTLSAIRGHGNMPARGGMAELTDKEIKRAIVYMFQQGGGAAKEETAPAKLAEKTAAAPAAEPAAGGKGKSVYDATCGACHNTGAAGAPKLGDKVAWAPRLKGGTAVLYTSALKGKAAMPPKGGNVGLPDADVKAAVDYMVAQAK